MENQIAFFNNINQIVYDYSFLMNRNQYQCQNLVKDSIFDKFNDTKSILSHYISNDNFNFNSNINDSIHFFENLQSFKNIELNDNIEYFIIVDKLTFNKFNITRFNQF